MLVCLLRTNRGCDLERHASEPYLPTLTSWPRRTSDVSRCAHVGCSFCFICLADAHSSCACEMWAIWKHRQKDDSETMNWITANTKPCPKCGKLVEKNGGCNLMTCRCGQHFCWLCGGSTGFDHTYHTISNHQCGRWKQELEKNIDEAASNHKRYMHYFTRWNGHRDSLNKELANKEATSDFLKKLCDEINTRDYEYNSLDSAVTVLTSARKVLSNSCVYAFFLCGNDWHFNEIHPDQIPSIRLCSKTRQSSFRKK